MTSLPYSTVDLTSEEVTSILSIFNSLERKHKVEFTSQFSFRFQDFSLFENYPEYSIGPVIEIKEDGDPFYLTFTRVCYKLDVASRFPVAPIEEYQTWLVLPLNRRYGHVLVKTETVFDKIRELIHPIEVDFSDDPDFSKEFYVLTGDESKAKSLLGVQLRSYLKRFPRRDIWIEVSEDKLILGNKKRIDIEAALEMADLVSKIAGLP